MEGADFINRMIERKPSNRLGINGPNEVKNHPWIVNFPWEKLKNRTLRAPYIPVIIFYIFIRKMRKISTKNNKFRLKMNKILN